MEKVKKVLDRIFIEGLSAMAHGLFATLIIGTIIQQIGTFMGGNIGEMIFIAGKLAAALTGAGIGVAVAYKFKEAPLVVVSAATAGMAGAFASSILAGKVFVDGTMVFAGPGEPLGAFIAAYVGIFFGHMVSGKTKVDILVTPVVTIGSGCLVGFLIVAGRDQTISTTSAGGNGFTAIIVAWLAKFNTFYMALISFLLIFLSKGASEIASAYSLNDYAASIIEGIILFFILGSEFFINYKMIFRGSKKEVH